jgi:dihydroorotate dehydrogenase (NAD+) catalytic subunit
MEMKQNDVNLCINLADIKMKNPVMVASGTFGYGEEYSDFINLRELGAIVTKSITLRPREKFISEKMPFLREITIPIIVSISGEDVSEYVEIAQRLNEVPDVSALELNISCPNVSKGGMLFGSDRLMTYDLVSAVRCTTKLPIIVKLSPNVTSIVEIALSAEQAGADVISLVNTLLGMAIDINTRRPKLGNITGGLSGPAIRPVAIRMVWQVFNKVRIPIIGMGGIMTADDALEFIIAGAKAVSIGTANFVNPMSALEIITGMREYLQQKSIFDVNNLVGSLDVSS